MTQQNNAGIDELQSKIPIHDHLRHQVEVGCKE
jgi:hypothetical protein